MRRAQKAFCLAGLGGTLGGTLACVSCVQQAASFSLPTLTHQHSHCFSIIKRASSRIKLIKSRAASIQLARSSLMLDMDQHGLDTSHYLGCLI